MSIQCPRCPCVMGTIESRKRKNGILYRRYECRGCGHREAYSEKISDGEGRKPPIPPGDRRFNREQVDEIIRSGASNAELAQQYGCSRELIRQIRAGELYRDVPRHLNRRFDAREVRQIIRADTTHAEEARQRGCTPDLISQIRSGKLYRDLLPYGHLPPDAAGPRCDRCHHWQGDCCGLGFPDPLEEGRFFARDCAAWVERGA